MHIPDNYLSPSTCAVMGALMVPVWTVSVNKVKKEMPKAGVPLLGVGAAFSFLIMMLNIPLPGGTSGHAIGGTLLAVLMGPYGACISMSVTLLIQALMFGDGGILAYGANCFNMAFVLPFAGYFIYRFIEDRAKSKKGSYLAIVLGSYFGINVAALCAAVEFGLQPLLFRDGAGQPLYSPYPLSVSIPAMVLPHLLLVGVAEAALSAAVYAFIKRVSPDTIYDDKRSRISAAYGPLALLICLSPAGLLAAGTAWGEWGVDELRGLLGAGKGAGLVPAGIKNGFAFRALMPDYSVRALPAAVGYILSAAAGAAILIIVFKIIGSLKKD